MEPREILIFGFQNPPFKVPFGGGIAILMRGFPSPLQDPLLYDRKGSHDPEPVLSRLANPKFVYEELI
jgi:hypothetical protein